MQKYFNTNTVSAEPMDELEAYEKGYVRSYSVSDYSKVPRQGYHVQYTDQGGSVCDGWSPKDVFERAYQVAETPFDRMNIEYKEESERYEKGKKFVGSMNFDKLNYLAKTLLSAQNESQREYCYLLADRMAQMSNKQVFPTNYDFGTAIKFLKAGGAIRRSCWKNGLPPIIKPFPEFTPTKRVEYNTDYDLVYIRTKDGSVAVTDGAFYDIVSKYTWDKDGNGYISASFKDKGRVHPHKLQNYIIPNIPKGYIVDHINGNKLDNRMCNLRFATIKENNANRASKCNSSSQYKGVSFDRSRGKWISSIQINGKTKHIGRFDDEREAAIAYDTEALSVYGEFARLNFPKMLEIPFVIKQAPANTNQMLIINPDGRADSWVPSSSDVFAEDWELVTQ